MHKIVLPLVVVLASQFTMIYTVPPNGVEPTGYDNTDIKNVMLLGYPRCPVWDRYPFDWKPCQYAASVMLIKDITGKQGKQDTLRTGPLTTTWTFWVVVGDEIPNWSAPSNMISNPYP